MYAGPHSVLCQQLDEILKWIEEFRQETKDAKDKVLFDILCGDLNFDNISPGSLLWCLTYIFNKLTVFT